MLMGVSGIRTVELAGEEAFDEQDEEGSQPLADFVASLLPPLRISLLETSQDDFCRGARIKR